jgi:hypothetical protein
MKLETSTGPFRPWKSAGVPSPNFPQRKRDASLKGSPELIAKVTEEASTFERAVGPGSDRTHWFPAGTRLPLCIGLCDLRN